MSPGLIWIVLAKGLGVALGHYFFPRLNQRFSPQLPLLFGIGVLLYLLSVALHYVLLSVESSREAETREQEALTLARESELKALKAQINPHFLFNSLNSISALATVDGARARDMCIKLSDFLRTTLKLGEKHASRWRTSWRWPRPIWTWSRCGSARGCVSRSTPMPIATAASCHRWCFSRWWRTR